MSSEQVNPNDATPRSAAWSFIGGFVGTLVLMALGLAVGTNFNSMPAVILSTIIGGSVLIVLGAMNGSRPIVAGGLTAFAVVLAVVGGCFMLLVPGGRL